MYNDLDERGINFAFILGVLSTSFIIIPYIANLIGACIIRNRSSIKNNSVASEWFGKNGSVFSTLVVSSGSVYATLSVTSSKAFGLDILDNGLTSGDLRDFIGLRLFCTGKR